MALAPPSSHPEPQAHSSSPPLPVMSLSLRATGWALTAVLLCAAPSVSASEATAALCKTDACRELLAPSSPPPNPLTQQEKRVRRVRAMKRETQEAAVAAEASRERARLEPAYMAKSEAERFELAVARREGATEEEAQARAQRAGKLAFDTMMEDAELREKEEQAFAERLAEKRRAVEAEAAAAAAASPSAGAGAASEASPPAAVPAVAVASAEAPAASPSPQADAADAASLSSVRALSFELS